VKVQGDLDHLIYIVALLTAVWIANMQKMQNEAKCVLEYLFSILALYSRDGLASLPH
jgi:hypothetical protein